MNIGDNAIQGVFHSHAFDPENTQKPGFIVSDFVAFRSPPSAYLLHPRLRNAQGVTAPSSQGAGLRYL